MWHCTFRRVGGREGRTRLWATMTRIQPVFLSDQTGATCSSPSRRSSSGSGGPPSCTWPRGWAGPVLVEGPAGVGKTELAKTLAEIAGRPLIRLQCYEGLDEAKALYEWKYAKQLLYTQLLRERIGELIADAPSLPDAVDRIAGQEDAFFSPASSRRGRSWGRSRPTSPVVLLVDEIDKAEPEFEAFLLEVLSDFQVSVPELGTIKAPHIPLVVLTSNNARELSDGSSGAACTSSSTSQRRPRSWRSSGSRCPRSPEQLARAVVARSRRSARWSCASRRRSRRRSTGRARW